MPCEKCWSIKNAAPGLNSCISPREREARPSHGTPASYWGRASLNLSIVSTWARKNGSFTSKLRPGFTERFYNRAQLTLARVARPTIEKHELPQSQEINHGSVFPRSCRFPLGRGAKGSKISSLWLVLLWSRESQRVPYFTWSCQSKANKTLSNVFSLPLASPSLHHRAQAGMLLPW